MSEAEFKMYIALWIFILVVAVLVQFWQIRSRIKIWNHKYIMRMLDHMYDADEARCLMKSYTVWRKLKTDGAEQAQLDHEMMF